MVRRTFGNTELMSGSVYSGTTMLLMNYTVLKMEFKSTVTLKLNGNLFFFDVR